jgi:hypothetical protein
MAKGIIKKFQKVMIPKQGNLRMITATGVIFMLLLAFSGCATSYWHFEQSPMITQIFDSYQSLPDHNYYFSGWEKKPDAIAGIHRNYTLTKDSGFGLKWKKFDPSAAALKEMVDGMHKQLGRKPNGALILDTTGSQVGVIYSLSNAIRRIKTVEDKRIAIWVYYSDDVASGP